MTTPQFVTMSLVVLVSMWGLFRRLERIELALRALAPGCTCPKRGGDWSSTCPAHKDRTPSGSSGQ